MFTFAYLATASHVLGEPSYSRLALCWSIMFVILSVIYRPVEQLLSRTIAERRARGLPAPVADPGVDPGRVRDAFLIASRLRCAPDHQRLFDGAVGPYVILVVGVLAYSASYFARGWLAGHRRFALYGSLVFLESTSRFLFALAVAVGIASGQPRIGVGWRWRRSCPCA